MLFIMIPALKDIQFKSLDLYPAHLRVVYAPIFKHLHNYASQIVRKFKTLDQLLILNLIH